MQIQVNDNRSIWNYFNKIAGACEHIDIKRKVTINESQLKQAFLRNIYIYKDLRAEIDRMKKDLDQKEVFIVRKNTIFTIIPYIYRIN